MDTSITITSFVVTRILFQYCLAGYCQFNNKRQYFHLYNIFAYCSICRVDCKFARNKKKHSGWHYQHACILTRKTWRSENSWPYRDSNSDHLVVNPVASRYAHCVITAHSRRKNDTENDIWTKRAITIPKSALRCKPKRCARSPETALREKDKKMGRGEAVSSCWTALTSPTSGYRSAGIVRSRSKATEFSNYKWSCIKDEFKCSLCSRSFRYAWAKSTAKILSSRIHIPSVVSVRHVRKHVARICMFVFVSTSPCSWKNETG
jgi:hypothetical protein